MTNTTHHGNTTMSDLNQKTRTKTQESKLKGKDVDNVETTNGPYQSTAKKGYKDNMDPTTDEKMVKKGINAKTRGKVSGEEKSSDDNAPRGPIIKEL